VDLPQSWSRGFARCSTRARTWNYCHSSFDPAPRAVNETYGPSRPSFEMPRPLCATARHGAEETRQIAVPRLRRNHSESIK